MGTINQPTPSNPKSPQPDQQPLQPGGQEISRSNSASPNRPMPETPESPHDKIRDR